MTKVVILLILFNAIEYSMSDTIPESTSVPMGDNSTKENGKISKAEHKCEGYKLFDAINCVRIKFGLDPIKIPAGSEMAKESGMATPTDSPGLRREDLLSEVFLSV